MAYKNILNAQTNEYNTMMKRVRKELPALSLKDKHSFVIGAMLYRRGLSTADMVEMTNKAFSKEFQYAAEVVALNEDIAGNITRYYLKDDSLFDFFKNTEVKQKDVQAILDMILAEFSKTSDNIWGVIGQDYSFTIMFTTGNTDKRHFITVFTDGMNYTFCVEEFSDKKDPNSWVYNMAVNFLFYIHAFPDCVVDGVPNGVKKNSNARVISVSDKVVSHKGGEHGFVRAHFRSGYFRHLNSDYFVNCKGQVRFIESTMVKGRAKTVIAQGGEADESEQA